MIEREELTDAEAELLPPGEYPFWTPYDSYEAAAILLRAFDEDKTMC